MPTPAELQNLYDTSWERPFQASSETGATDRRLARVYVERLLNSLEVPDLRGARVLDFGAGRGAVIAALAEAGAVPVGIEPFGIDFLRQQGIDAHETLEDLPATARFSGVVMLDVIEHLDRPGDVVRMLLDRIELGGWFLVATPNAASVRARITRHRWAEAAKPGHLILFSPCGLEALLERSGAVEVRRLRWFVGYSRNPVRNLLHYLQQALGVDGQLRYLVRGHSD